ncbi:MAG: inositol monophosphatase family protein [Candidatus Hodarchaeota archaeon]
MSIFLSRGYHSLIPPSSSIWNTMIAIDDQYLSVAIAAAKSGGDVLLDMYGKVEIAYKLDQSIVTRADLHSDNRIRKILTKEFPKHSILSEESGKSFESEKGDSSEYLWAIDPLDGTTNYTTRNPFFGVSIGLLVDQQPFLGVIYFPIQDELFYAKVGAGAFLNDRRIHVESNASFENTFLSYGNARDIKNRQIIAEIFPKLKIKNNTVRQVGSPALALCFVAAGRFGAFFMPGVKLWDVTAGVVIVQEANGRVTDFLNKPFSLNSTSIIAASSTLHSEILPFLTNTFS